MSAVNFQITTFSSYLNEVIVGLIDSSAVKF